MTVALLAYLTMDSVTFFPSNIPTVSLSGMGSTEQDWMSGTVSQGQQTHTHTMSALTAASIHVFFLVQNAKLL